MNNIKDNELKRILEKAKDIAKEDNMPVIIMKDSYDDKLRCMSFDTLFNSLDEGTYAVMPDGTTYHRFIHRK